MLHHAGQQRLALKLYETIHRADSNIWMGYEAETASVLLSVHILLGGAPSSTNLKKNGEERLALFLVFAYYFSIDLLHSKEVC